MSEQTSPEAVLAELSRFIDISCVQAFHDEAAVRELADSAKSGNFVSAHVLPHWAPLLRKLLRGSATLTGAPAGFPSGGSTTQTKAAEARQLLDLGVQELDVVVNIGRLRSGDFGYVTDELGTIVSLVRGTVPLRAILEVGYLDEGQIRAGVACALQAGVPWIKTGTGWSGRPTELFHVALIAEEVGGRAQIKAAGGIRDLATVHEMVALGVTRFGVNAAVARDLVAASSTGQKTGLAP